ncbi:MAG: aldose 1-epimerase family protein [Ktedonobacterales bacterium]
MAHLYGRDWTRQELLRHVGELAQVARVQRCELRDGRARGIEALDVDAGDGLRFTVLPSRCMDIPYFEYRGVPLVWHARNGLVAPAYYEPEGNAWLRSFFGGLLTTCGLRNAGPPCDYQGEPLGLHGRIGNTPAEDVQVGGDWHGDEYTLWMSGTMRESRVFAEDLRLERRISVHLGGRSIRVSNRVENRGDQESPLMVLFHVNHGFPVVSPGARLIVADAHVEPRDEVAQRGMAEHARFGSPQRGWSEQVYYHKVRSNADGWAHTAVVNEQLELPFARGIGLQVSWRPEQLANLIEWKQLGEGDYVVGTEPANCRPEGCAAAAQNGRLEVIKPGETREFELEFTVLVGTEEIATFEQSLPS